MSILWSFSYNSFVKPHDKKFCESQHDLLYPNPLYKLLLYNFCSNTFSELPVCSPLLHAVLRVIEQWEEVLLGKLELFAAPPENYIPGVEVDLTPGIPTSKYRALMKQNNSPFM